jgi:hypothetical protein
MNKKKYHWNSIYCTNCSLYINELNTRLSYYKLRYNQLKSLINNVKLIKKIQNGKGLHRKK